MRENVNPDVYVCALLTEMVTLIQSALAMEQEHDFDTRIALCKERLDDEQIRETIGLLAYLARIDG